MPATRRPGHWHPRQAEAQTYAHSLTHVCVLPPPQTHVHSPSSCWVRAGLRVGTLTSTEGPLIPPRSRTSSMGPGRWHLSSSPNTAQMHTVHLIPKGLCAWSSSSQGPWFHTPSHQTRLAFVGGTTWVSQRGGDHDPFLGSSVAAGSPPHRPPRPPALASGCEAVRRDRQGHTHPTFWVSIWLVSQPGSCWRWP